MPSDISSADLHFLRVLLGNDGCDIEIGTGQFPRGMSDRRAAELWRAGYVTGAPHHFRGGWSGIRYSIAERGRQAVENHPTSP